MKASVVIPTKNPGPAFRSVLEAVLAQEAPWAFDVLVVDSGSRDGTVQYVRDLGVPVHIISPGEFGHGRTRNLGAAMTRGEWIVFLTHDALPADNHWLYRLIVAGEQDEEIAGVFGRHLPYPDASPFLARDLERHFDGFRQLPGVVRLEEPERYARDPGYRQMLHFFSDNNAAVRRRVWRSIPYPDVEFAEDQVWAKTIIEAGYAKAYADDARVYHSHDFGFVNRVRRSFDESMHWKRLFGYDTCPSLRHLIRETRRGTQADWRYARQRRLRLRHYIDAPLRNLGHQMGAFLGQRVDRIPPRLVGLISRDRALRSST